jgi:hypothetical protein
VVSGPVAISGPITSSSDGFTVLPNGNFLINTGFNSCTYNQFNPATGAVIPSTTITLAGFGFCTGVATNGVHLFFKTNTFPGGVINNFVTETDLTGFVIATKPDTAS